MWGQADAVLELRMEMARAEAGDLGQFGDCDASRQVPHDMRVQALQVERPAGRQGLLLAEQAQVQGADQYSAESTGQQRVAAVAGQFGAGVAEQVLEVGVQGRVARRLEQAREQVGVFRGRVVLAQVDDQHAVVAHPGEHVARLARHQAGAHPADFPATAIDLEFGAPGQRHHQLVMFVGVGVRLVGQTDEAGVEHERQLLNFCALYSTCPTLPSTLPQVVPAYRVLRGNLRQHP